MREALTESQLRALKYASTLDDHSVDRAVESIAKKLVEDAGSPLRPDHEAPLGVKEAIAFVRNMMPVSDVTFNQRMNICKSCENIKQISLGELLGYRHQCQLCKCIMDAKAKFVGGSCPAGKF